MSNFGRYQIMRELGRGGMGVVYQCYDPQLKRYVALKIVNESLGSEIEQHRFEREAHLTAKLNHPHIIRIFDIGRDQGRYFITMELVEGQSMARFLEENCPLPQVIQILIKVAQALHYAHQQGVIHRDVKPSNIMVSRDGEPKVMDFGLAKEIGATAEQAVKGAPELLSKNMQVVGTPEYMAPEQANGKIKEVDARSDIYALGMILYRVLAGRLPFSTHDTINVIYQIIFHEPKPPSYYDRTIPRDLEAICLKAIDKEKGRRYQNGVEFAEDLQRYLDGRPVMAQPVTAWVRMHKWVRRHRVLSMLGAAVSVLLLTLIAGFVYQSHRQAKIEHQLRQLAEQEKKEAQLQRKIAEEQKSNAVQKEAEARHSAVEAKLSQAEAELVLARTALDSQNHFCVREAQKKSQLLLLEAQAALAESLSGEVGTHLRPSFDRQALREQILRTASSHIERYCLAAFPDQRGEIPFTDVDLAAAKQAHLIAYFPPPCQLYTPVQPSWKYHLFSRGNKEELLLWDMAAKKEISTLPLDRLHDVRVATFSKDDAWLAMGDFNGKVVAYEIATGKVYANGIVASSDIKYTEIRTLCFSDDASLLLAANMYQTVVWKMPHMTQVLSCALGGKKMVAAFSRNNKWLALGNLDSKLSVYLLEIDNAGQPKPLTLPNTANSLCFGPDDKSLLIGDFNDIRVWPFSSALDKETVSLVGAHRGRVLDMALSDDGSLFASLGQDGRLAVWSTYNYRKLWEGPVAGNLVGTQAIAFHPGLPRIGVWNSLVSLYDWDLNVTHRLDLLNDKMGPVPTNRTNLLKLMRRTSIIRNLGHTQVAIAFSPQQPSLVSYMSPSLYQWDIENNTVDHIYSHFPAYQFHYMRFSSDGTLLLWRRREQTLLFRMPTREQIAVFTDEQHKGDLMFQPGTNLLVADKGMRLCFYRLDGGKLQQEREMPVRALGPGRFFDAAGTRMALCSARRIIEVWDIADNKTELLSQQTLPVQGDIENAVCFSADGFLGIGTLNGEFLIYDWQKQAIHHKVSLHDPIRHVRFDPHAGLYWIHTQSGLLIYPHLAEPGAVSRIDRIYPLPLFAGYPLVAMDIDSEFRRLALVLQSGEIMVMEFVR